MHLHEQAQNGGDYLPIELLFWGESALGYKCVLRLEYRRSGARNNWFVLHCLNITDVAAYDL